MSFCAFAQLLTTFIFFSAWDRSRVKWDNSQNSTQKMRHCRFLVPDNTQKILTEIWHHFWLKSGGEKGSRKNYFKIPRWPSELLLPSAKKSAQKGWIFSRPLFTIILSQKWCQISVRIFCVLPGTKNLQWYVFNIIKCFYFLISLLRG